MVESEKGRIRERLEGHYNNDVWEMRSEPLSEAEWNPPLPESITQGYESSFLKKKVDGLKSGEEVLGDVEANMRDESLVDGEGPSYCSIV